VRLAAGATLGAAAVLPALPGHPGLPCPLRTLTGVPCPFCGMTTSVEATVHGHLGHAFAANPAGIAVVALSVWLLARRPAALRYSLPVVYAAMAAMWLFELRRFALL
jgi:hypothetical protein